MSDVRLAGRGGTRDVTPMAEGMSGRGSSAIAVSAFALALFLLTACAGVGAQIVAPKVSVKTFAIGAVRGGDAAVTVSLRVENPNLIDLTLQSLRFAFSVNDIALTKGATLQSGTIAAGGTEVIDVETHTDINAVLRLLSLPAGRGAPPLQYVLEGEAIVQNGIHLPFSRRGDIPAPGATSPAQPH
jgi:LEA14-like dessication related protein